MIPSSPLDSINILRPQAFACCCHFCKAHHWQGRTYVGKIKHSFEDKVRLQYRNRRRIWINHWVNFDIFDTGQFRPLDFFPKYIRFLSDKLRSLLVSQRSRSSCDVAPCPVLGWARRDWTAVFTIWIKISGGDWSMAGALSWQNCSALRKL